MLDESTSALFSEGFCSAYGRCDLGEFKASVISTNKKKMGSSFKKAFQFKLSVRTRRPGQNAL